MSNPTYSADLCTNVESIEIVESHGAACTMAMVKCRSFSGDIGSEINVYVGYDNSNTKKFNGYVKEIHKEIPDNTYSIIAYDKLVRASDFTLVASNPDEPFSRSNIALENLARDLLLEAGLSSFDLATSYFTVATKNPVEIDLVSVYDYCKNLAELMAWSIWCDVDGTIHFKNRKPFVMDGSTGEIGDVADTPTGYTITDSLLINLTYTLEEKNLRNRVVIRGQDVYAEASASSPYLPSGFYKTAVLAAPQLIDDQSIAQEAADINLNAFNHLTEIIDCTVEGNASISARTVITMDEDIIGITGNWYVYSNTIVISKQGFLNQLNLRRIA